MLEAVKNGKTPEEWAELLSSRGMPLSSRLIRSKARELGCFYSLGHAMILSTDHVETLLTAEAKGLGKKDQSP